MDETQLIYDTYQTYSTNIWSVDDQYRYIEMKDFLANEYAFKMASALNKEIPDIVKIAKLILVMNDVDL